MDKRDIDFLLQLGLWVQVSPLAHNNGWVCAVYKQGPKTGNWVTEMCKTFDHPYECYDWAKECVNEIKSKHV
jgi:hypothetical protein